MKLTVHLDYDQDAENPMDYDGQWKLVSFGSRHSNHEDPENYFPLSIGLRQKLNAGTAFLLSYFEHGNCVWDVMGRMDHYPDFNWDGVRCAGILLWEHPVKELGPKTYEAREQDARNFCEVYTKWCNGWFLCYSIEDEDGNCIDSCCGFDDGAYMFEQIGDMIRWWMGEQNLGEDDVEVEFEGDAEVLANYHDLKLTA